MRSLLFSLTVLGAVFGLIYQAEAAEPQTRVVMISVSEALLPEVQDSRSEAYAVIAGIFQNGCYSWSHAVVHHKSEFEHEVRSFANLKTGVFCTMALVPFIQQIQLGQLATGTHHIRFVNADDTYLDRQLVVR